MRYMFLMYSQETVEGPSPEEVDYLIRTHGALIEEMRRKGVLVGFEGLKGTHTATTVRPDGTGHRWTVC
jgi:hypothetical protein